MSYQTSITRQSIWLAFFEKVIVCSIVARRKEFLWLTVNALVSIQDRRNRHFPNSMLHFVHPLYRKCVCRRWCFHLLCCCQDNQESYSATTPYSSEATQSILRACTFCYHTEPLLKTSPLHPACLVLILPPLDFMRLSLHLRARLCLYIRLLHLCLQSVNSYHAS
jgi:hypothetical protein